MRVISLTGATSVLDPVHGEHHAGHDGVFELPQQFADHLLKTAAGSFRGEADHHALLARESLEQLRDPRVAQLALSSLRDRMDVLEARVAELEAPRMPATGGAGTELGSELEFETDAGGSGVAETEEPVADDESPEDVGDESAAEEAADQEKPEEAPKATAKRRPGTDTPPRVRSAAKRQA